MNSTHPSTFRLRRRTPGSFVLVPCPRIGRALRCQGQLERATALVIAACPQVTGVWEQPLEIWYSWRETDRDIRIRLLDERPGTRTVDGDRVSHIVPDFLVSMQHDIIRLVEVKPSRKLANEIVHRKLCVARLHALKSGWMLHVLTERELLCSPLPRVLSLIARYRVVQSDSLMCFTVSQLVPTNGISIGNLLKHVNDDAAKAKTHIYHLLAMEELSFDPSVGTLNDDTLVYPKGAL